MRSLRVAGLAIALRLRPGRIEFANSADREEISITNETSVGADGWAQLAPWGDFPGEVFITQAGAAPKSYPAIQRLDREAGKNMVEAFNSLGGRMKRWLSGVNIYHGHPDAVGRGHQYPDKASKGVIAELAIREDGLYGRPVFSNEGIALLESQSGLAFSARWSAAPAGEEGGKKIFRPDRLLSAGLTTRPNLPVEAVNETPAMDLTKLIILLRQQGYSLDDAADIAQITSALEAGPSGGTTVANEAAKVPDLSKRIATLEGELANERKGAADAVAVAAGLRTRLGTALFDAALREGRVTEADRAGFATRFTADFANAETDLAARKPTALKTASKVGDVKPAAVAGANPAARVQQAQEFVNEKMKAGLDYDRAFAAALAERPELFGKAPTAAAA